MGGRAGGGEARCLGDGGGLVSAAQRGLGSVQPSQPASQPSQPAQPATSSRDGRWTMDGGRWIHDPSPACLSRTCVLADTVSSCLNRVLPPPVTARWRIPPQNRVPVWPEGRFVCLFANHASQPHPPQQRAESPHATTGADSEERRIGMQGRGQPAQSSKRLHVPTCTMYLHAISAESPAPVLFVPGHTQSLVSRTAYAVSRNPQSNPHHMSGHTPSLDP